MTFGATLKQTHDHVHKTDLLSALFLLRVHKQLLANDRGTRKEQNSVAACTTWAQKILGKDTEQ
jgi:hypothetical protein